MVMETRRQAAERAASLETMDTVVQRLRLATIKQGQQRRARRRHRCCSVAWLRRMLRDAAVFVASQVSQRYAAVLVPLMQDARGNVSVLLTQRSSKVSTHKGEVCLPGGKRDATDLDDTMTALREAHEELGLPPTEATVLCQMRPFLSKHLLSVTPVVARIPDAFVSTPNPDEVSAVFTMPLASFLSSDNHSAQDISWHGLTYRLHYFEHEGYTVWGLTAAIMMSVAQLALGRPPAFQEHAPDGHDYRRLHHDGTRLLVRSPSPEARPPDADS